MKCKDCIYYDKCCADDVDFEFYALNIQEETKCHFFKDKSKFVELPCDVGDKVFILLEQTNGEYEIIKSFCIEYVARKLNNKCEYWSMYFDCPEIGNSLEFYRSDFGKEVFLTKSEAEARLKELECEQK